jgi:DNA segregation ATPase FtsK/SpoIIIE-like protein
MTMTEQTVDAATLRLANRLFRTMRQTLINRGLYQQRQDGTIREVEWIGWTPWLDQRAFAFVLDTGTMPVSIERLCDEKVIHQVSTALGGRRVEVVNHRGVAWLLAMDLPPLEDPQPRRRLPRQVSLNLDAVPEGSFMVPLGAGHDGPVCRSLLDLDCILVGGVRGYGKTTFLFSALVALLQQHGPHEFQVAIVDPKGFDFSLFDGIPHLWAERSTGAEAAARLLADLVAEMEDRGEQFARLGVRSLEAFNEVSPEPLPLLLVVIDEVTDLMLEAGKQASALQRDLVRLISKGRAAGIILLVATQNPKSEVFSTLARGNFRTRIAFWVSEAVMSRTILNRPGAEHLPQVRGRMLALMEGQSEEPAELQGYWLDDEAIKAVVGELAGREYAPLTAGEQLVFAWAAAHDGYLGIEDIARLLDMTAWQARKLAATWERHGWLEKDRSVGNKRRVTDGLRALLPECEGL